MAKLQIFATTHDSYRILRGHARSGIKRLLTAGSMVRIRPGEPVGNKGLGRYNPNPLSSRRGLLHRGDGSDAERAIIYPKAARRNRTGALFRGDGGGAAQFGGVVAAGEKGLDVARRLAQALAIL